MAEPVNPYRHDVPGEGPFVGRQRELEVLDRAVKTGRSALAAVMGGRGMGKTSLLGQLRHGLEADESRRILVVERVASKPEDFVRQLSKRLGVVLEPSLFVDDLVQAIDEHHFQRTALLLDEVDGLVGSDEGRDVLENLRVAYEQLGGALSVIVFGGSKLRQLLTSDVSPFLRTARWIRLVGLSVEETSNLVNEPLGLGLDDSIVETLWEQTGGHPLLLQALMELAVDLGPPVVEHLAKAMERLREEILEPRIFPIWWDNLTERGRRAYRILLEAERPIPRELWARRIGDDPAAVVEILESTGLARVENGLLFARSSLFAAWLERSHPENAQETAVHASPFPEPSSWYDQIVDDFERLVVSTIERWARHVVEHPTPYLRSNSKLDNSSLVPEQNFQLGLVGALRQHDLIAEPEPLSSLRGRVDVKVRPLDAPASRTCVELKIWGRNDYKDVVGQLLGYCMAEDDFGCIVMLDRAERPLGDVYDEECLASDTKTTWESEQDRVSLLAKVTEHPRPVGRALRVYHFLVQLPR